MNEKPTRARLRFHDLAVTAVEPAAADGSAVAVTCRVPPDLRPVFEFAPGQHVAVRARIGGVEIRRTYSLSSTPAELARDGVLRIGVRKVPGGALSSHLHDGLAAGCLLGVLPPVGGFVRAAETGRRYGAIVAGSGITPVLSLAATVLADEPASTFTVLYGNRGVDSMMFAGELADLKDRYLSRFQLMPVFSREAPRMALSGRLDMAVLRRVFARVVDPGTIAEWFVCGPPGLVSTARQALGEYGVDSSAVHTELFHTGPAATPRRVGPPQAAQGPGRELRIVLDGRVSTVRVPGEVRLLDAGLQARPELPYSCRTGVCSTCRARVTEGAAVMDRDWGLSADDRAAGYVLSCQSRAVSDRITLDFDVV